MPGVSKIRRDYGIGNALEELSTFSKKEQEIRKSKAGSKEEVKAEQGFNRLIQNLMEFKRKIKRPATLKSSTLKQTDKVVLKKIESALKFFENAEQGEKMRILKGTLFWEKLFGFQVLLENLQDTRFKRGRKVEKIEKSNSGKK